VKGFDNLIEYCRSVRVPLKPLDAVTEVRSGWGFPHAHQGKSVGDYPFYKVSDMNLPGNKLVMGAANNYVDAAAARKLGVTPAPAGTVIFPKIGAAVATNKKRLLSVASAYDNNVMGLVPGEELVPRYLLYWMQTLDLTRISNDSGAVPSIRKSEMQAVHIPVPTLEVQRAIVSILDQFAQLEAELETELEAELEARRRQFLHYRERLLTIGHIQSRRMRLEELFDLRAGRFVSASDIVSRPDIDHSIPCFGGGGLRGYVTAPNQEGDVVLIGRQGALCGNVKRATGKFYATEHAVVVTPKDGVDITWGYHMLSYMNLNQYASKSAQPGLAVSALNRLVVDVPPFDEQAHIASVLDAFDALVNDFSVALPAELGARRKQYEHYRGRLLAFPKAAA